MPSKTSSEEKALIEWRAPEFRRKAKSLDWFFGVALITTALAIWAIFTLNIMFLLVVLIGTSTLLMWALKKPRTYHFKMTSSGVWIGKNIILFDSLESFWVFNFPEEQILSLKPKNRLAPGTHIIIPEEKAAQIKTVLSQYLPEVEEQYSFADWLADWLRF